MVLELVGKRIVSPSVCLFVLIFFFRLRFVGGAGGERRYVTPRK